MSGLSHTAAILKQAGRTVTAICLLLAALLTSACSTTPNRHTDDRQDIVSTAKQMIGVPYRYGGITPRGFDCSGLVYYSYARAGIPIPRTTKTLYRQASPRDLDQIQPGDLLFFRLSGNKVSHVAIYAGKQRFIHAPSTGKHVSYGSLDNPYWQKRLVMAGRL